MKFFSLCSLLVIGLLSGAGRPVANEHSSTIEGIVVSSNTNQPVSQVHVYVVKGEEESITSGNGKFSLTTWQTFPVSLSVEHPEYKKIKLVIKEAGSKQVIHLEPK